MSEDYAAFLATKAPRTDAVGFEPRAMPPHLFDFQAAVTEFSLRQGRAGCYLATGLGKTFVELEWCRQAAEATNGRALLLTPLAVARQIEREGARFGYDVRVIRGREEVGTGINVCNYDRLDRLDPAAFGAVALDEASILKSIDGKTRARLTAAFAQHRFRLAATATPAPNDHMEIGQQAEFLGSMTAVEMLSRWFVNDSGSASRLWRLKGHAEQDFWNWMASWARMAESPEDLGFDGSRFVLPGLEVMRHRVAGAAPKPKGALFHTELSATEMHSIKRQTATSRAELVAELVATEPDETWVLWVDTDHEADAVMAAVPGAFEVRGSHPIERKEDTLDAFAAGEIKRLVTKSSITGYGVNWQFCARTACVGRSFSYEQWHQLVRRFWRFGQTRDVHVHLAVAEGEEQIGRVLDRKAADQIKMREMMTAAMRRNMGRAMAVRIPYEPKHIGEWPTWLT